MDDWCTSLGHRITHIQRAALLLGGPDIHWNPLVDDDNPPRYYEPLPSGPLKGQTTDRTKVMADKTKYYKSLGWDKRGIPTPETLQRLGLSNLESVYNSMR